MDTDNGNLYTCASPAAGGTPSICDHSADWVLNSSSSTSGVSTAFGRSGTVVATAGDYTAAQVTTTPAGTLAAITQATTNAELDAEKQPLDTDLTEIAGLSCADDLIPKQAGGVWTCGADGGGAVTAADVATTPAGTLAATTQDATNAELDAEKHPLMSDPDPCAGNGFVIDWGEDGSISCSVPTGAQVLNTGAGDIVAADVQAAITELDTEKQPVDADLTTFGGLSCSDGQIAKKVTGAWTCASDGGGAGLTRRGYGGHHCE